jgi:prophage regulatory protein
MLDTYLPKTGYVRLSTILKIIPVGKTTWWNGVKSGKYPKSVKLGKRITAWRAEDIHQLIFEMNNGGVK